MQQKNLLLAFVLSALIMVGWIALSHYFWPPPPTKQNNAEVATKTDDENKPKGEEAKKPGLKEKGDEKKTAEKKPEEKKVEKESKRVAGADLQQLRATPDKDI